MVTKQFMLTTVDNPFNPFEDYKSWLSFDNEHNYNTAGRVMRVANVTEEMSSYEENLEIERAIEEIIKNDVLNIYKKVSADLTYPDE